MKVASFINLIDEIRDFYKEIIDTNFLYPIDKIRDFILA